VAAPSVVIRNRSTLTISAQRSVRSGKKITSNVEGADAVTDEITEEAAEAAEPREVREALRKLVADSGPTRRRQIGERRERLFVVAPGFYPPAEGSKEELIEIADHGAPLVRIDVLGYRLPAVREDPGWQLKGWREPTEEELADHYRAEATRIALQGVVAKCKMRRTPLRMTWWRRLWRRVWHPFDRRKAVPPARVVERG
jgi:hypothetical protein